MNRFCTMILLCATIHVIQNGCREWIYHPFCNKNRLGIRRNVIVVLASWSLSSDKLECNCAEGMVDGFNLLKCTISNNSIEMDFYNQRLIVSKLVHWVIDIFQNNHVCIFILTYCNDSQTCHAVYQSSNFYKDVNMWQIKIQNFNWWNVIFLNENPKYCMISVKEFSVL